MAESKVGSEVEVPVNAEVKEAADEYVEKLFSKSNNDFELVALLRELACKRVYHDMISNPDEYKSKPQLASVESWDGTKPAGPRDFLKKKVVLPSLPQVLIQIQNVLNDPDSSANDLAEVISMDPKLVAAILRLANSAMYSFRTEVDTPTRAVALLGFKQAGSLAVGTVSLSLFKRSKISVLELEKFWKHSIACGIIAQEIARLANLGDPERFFVSGLLHDIGLYVIFESEKSLAVELLRIANQEGKSLYGAERKLLGFDHAILGGVIIKDWSFPKTLVVAAAGHHNPEKAKNDPDAGVVHIADYVSRALGYDLGVSPILGAVSEGVWDNLGITFDQFKELIPQFELLIDDIFEILKPE
ncbi:HD-like signal output (HDOD) domain, no enzymatic activity [Maridesulfovibrio ferrireducens]|uniref:HD-like signal output (HDOD) domain, no enzymatic activity n=1 Tax=Maridesulfovibrio ferrireducens TaxID=246191 RepID=A0A1G9F189_9BACT|nr:HDOD domain-containing protein [Maridesulfovibrio ferrireducens]SDK82130.1 HD-like signal output (HDOD) domain, no enzymatic activity [Maridesulfovibrio ferrireducens]